LSEDLEPGTSGAFVIRNITGVDEGVTLTVTGDASAVLSNDSGATSSTSVTYVAGQTLLAVFVEPAATYDTTRVQTAYVNGVEFTATTVTRAAPDLSPLISFTPVYNAELSTPTLVLGTITDVEPGATLTVEAGAADISNDGGVSWDSAKTYVVGQTVVRLLVMSAATYSTSTSDSVTINGEIGTATLRTKRDPALPVRRISRIIRGAVRGFKKQIIRKPIGG
jgi:hypothetical protein